MKETLIRMNTRKFLRGQSLRSNIPYNQALNIGVLFTVEDQAKHALIKDFVRRLESDGKKVQVLEFLPDKKENYEFKYPFFTNKDFSFFGSLHSNDAMHFINMRFDYLFVPDLTTNTMIQHIVSRSKASCRAGKYFEGGEAYFDLMIESVTTVNELINSLYSYTVKL